MRLRKRLKIGVGCDRMNYPVMSDPKPDNQSPSKTEPCPSATPADAAAPGGLTKEEQWALFEKELKESDWGHQPC
jgi:hypothetical protein